MVALINGQSADQLTITDRGLNYGDGLFETMHVVNGRVRHRDLHMARLQRGCQALSMQFPDRELLDREIDSLAAPSAHGVLKLILTRGSGGRGYRPPDAPATTRILQRHAYPDFPQHYWRDGVRVRYCELQLARQPALAGIKHLNRLEQVLARREWNNPDIVEGLVCDQKEQVIEGISSNLFIVVDGIVKTPDLAQCGVAGVMRQCVLAAMQAKNQAVQITTLTKSDISGADEIFLTNSLIGIWPVNRLDQHRYHVGPLTRDLQRHLSCYG